jgi:hypothetical protein
MSAGRRPLEGATSATKAEMVSDQGLLVDHVPRLLQAKLVRSSSQDGEFKLLFGYKSRKKRTTIASAAALT